MSRTTKREVTFAIVLAGLTSILYRYWLVYPILHYLSLDQWRCAAILLAALIGATCSLVRLPIRAVLAATAVGLLSGGTCAALFFPTDVRVTVFSALTSHLESFWREVIILTIVTTSSSSIVSRFRSLRSH